MPTVVRLFDMASVCILWLLGRSADHQSRPANITSFTLFVVREHAGQIREQLGFTELNTAECVARFTGGTDLPWYTIRFP